MEHDQLLTAEQARQRLGLGHAAFWKLVKRHSVPQFRGPVRPGGRAPSLFRPQDLERLRRPAGRLLRSI